MWKCVDASVVLMMYMNVPQFSDPFCSQTLGLVQIFYEKQNIHKCSQTRLLCTCARIFLGMELLDHRICADYTFLTVP